MNSRPSSKITATLTDLLTSHEYNDVTGTVTTNVCDGLFAIAGALNRVATAYERSADAIEKSTMMQMQMAAQAQQRSEMIVSLMESTRGHDA